MFGRTTVGAFTAITQKLENENISGKQKNPLVLHKSEHGVPTEIGVGKKSLFSSGKTASEKMEALKHVTTALKEQYNLTADEAKSVLADAKVGKKEISYKNLKALPEVVAQKYPEKAMSAKVTEAQAKWQALRAKADSSKDNVAPHVMTVPELFLFKNEDLDPQKHADSKKIVMYGDGTGGAFGVHHPDPSKSVVVKIEQSINIEIAEKQSEFTSAITKILGGNDKLRFEPVPFVSVDFASAKPLLTEKLGEAKVHHLDPKDAHSAADSKTQEKREKAVESIDQDLKKLASPNGYSVGKTKVVNGTALNRLPAADQAAFLKTPTFAKDLGQLASLSLVLKYADHVNVDQHGYTNPTNLMLSADTGKLAVIDNGPPPGKVDRSTGKALTVQLDDKTSTQAATSLMETLSKAASEGVGSLKDSHAFSGAFDAFLTADEMYFSAEALEDLSPQDIEAFKKNFLLGVIDGLDILQSHSDDIAKVGKDFPLFIQNPDKFMKDLSVTIGDLGPIKSAIERQ